ncbi:purine-nucleoside phosphorylase [Mycoplasmopsis maculosa]|uniref:Uridine phosphorylase n=1 Tax=Mycoplasmopsis maculosa TaxID=114885 RepID=A0A449B495_9BACT|nr:purine nucleoside phosphorylase DeoD-type [Mycoplasmopsis maculosa]VEU75431.1 purine-nucleoside phosphorylase [Mycoplasmopsis maculosa]
MSIHINAKKNDIARIVILSGDPNRMKFMAYKYLDDVKEVSNLRNASFYTGYYKGKKITFGSHGMGQYSTGTYANELYVEYGVDVIIRCGSASTYRKEWKLLDLVIINRSYSDNTAISMLNNNELQKVYYPDKILTDELINSAKKLNFDYKIGSVHSADVFYSIRNIEDTIKETASDVVDAESYALFAVAKRYGKKAASILQISDILPNMEFVDSITREQKFNKSFETVLQMISDYKAL